MLVLLNKYSLDFDWSKNLLREIIAHTPGLIPTFAVVLV